MNEMNSRLAFRIVDEVGRVLLSFPAYSRDIGSDIFDGMSQSEIKQIIDAEHGFISEKRLIADKNGKACLIGMSLFPSTRTMITVPTEIPTDYARKLALDGSLGETILSITYPKKKKFDSGKLEKVYFEFSEILSFFETLRPRNAFYNSSIMSRELSGKIQNLAYLAGCEVDILLSHYMLGLRGGFDEGVFTLFMLTFLSIAANESPERRATVEISMLDGAPLTIVKFLYSESPCDAGSLQYKGYASAAIRYCKSIAERLNMFFIIRCEKYLTAAISPIRADVSVLGLKAPLFSGDEEELFHEEEQEQ